jgi:hypothetical protein
MVTAAVVVILLIGGLLVWRVIATRVGGGSSSTGTGGTGSTSGPSFGQGTTGVTVAAAGDMSCDPAGAAAGDEDGDGKGPGQCQDRAVSDLVLSAHPAAFLPLGDNQYDSGTAQAYRGGYDKTFGRLLTVTHPVPGNHEYKTGGAAGYFGYFGARAGDPVKGYYSYDLGGWHLVALNSNCDEVSCDAGSDQEQWLRKDLAAHPARCTLAYWHHPRWSSGMHGDNESVAPLVQALYDGHADVILGGHDHHYQRYEQRSPSGDPDADHGLREFVVGTGGRTLRDAAAVDGSQALESSAFGALFLNLQPTSYRWEFRPVGGSSFVDRGSAACH